MRPLCPKSQYVRYRLEVVKCTSPKVFFQFNSKNSLMSAANAHSTLNGCVGLFLMTG